MARRWLEFRSVGALAWHDALPFPKHPTSSTHATLAGVVPDDDYHFLWMVAFPRTIDGSHHGIDNFSLYLVIPSMDWQLYFESGRFHDPAFGHANLATPNKYYFPDAAAQPYDQVSLDGDLRDHDNSVLEYQRDSFYLLSILT